MKPCPPRPFALVLVLLAGLAPAFPESAVPPASVEPGRPAAVPFEEVWGYLMQGEEKYLVPSLPLSDIGYFSARLDIDGRLYGVPPVARIRGFRARKHLVVAEISNAALTHFALDPAYPARDRLVADIAEAAVPFDGVQIDFEAVPARDKAAYLDFLARLKRRLGAKTLSVALPARTGRTDEAYDYAATAAIVDRIVVMAYDEHWSGSAPGAIASLAWSAKVAKYAVSAIGAGKLVMGMPFYGRAWGDKNPAGAYKHSSARRVLDEKALAASRDAEGIPFFRFAETITYTLYFEDRESLARRAAAYRARGVSKLAFWRLGQEDPAVWPELSAAAFEAFVERAYPIPPRRYPSRER